MTPATARLLLSLLDQVTLSGSAPDLLEVATAMTSARTEALAALDGQDPA